MNHYSYKRERVRSEGQGANRDNGGPQLLSRRLVLRAWQNLTTPLPDMALGAKSATSDNACGQLIDSGREEM